MTILYEVVSCPPTNLACTSPVLAKEATNNIKRFGVSYFIIIIIVIIIIVITMIIRIIIIIIIIMGTYPHYSPFCDRAQGGYKSMWALHNNDIK